MSIKVHGRSRGGGFDVSFDGERRDVPDDYANADRQRLAAWEAAGNSLPPAMPLLVPIEAVKAEAGRRIEAIMPPYRQSNFHALFAETSMAYGTDPQNWPDDKKAVLATAMPQWNEIKRLRARSNEIEAMNPIPADFRKDSYWTTPA